MIATWRGTAAGAATMARVLGRTLGARGGAAAMAAVLAGLARGEPWRTLPPPEGRRDRQSRAQLGGAVVLYRVLRPRLGDDAALAAVREVVLAGGQAFLAAALPALAPDRLAALAPSLARRFFNAEGEVTTPAPGRVDFTVARCRFVELLAAVGAPELAPLCCAVDAAYFAGHPGVRLERPETLASGGARCDFRFHATLRAEA